MGEPMFMNEIVQMPDDSTAIATIPPTIIDTNSKEKNILKGEVQCSLDSSQSLPTVIISEPAIEVVSFTVGAMIIEMKEPEQLPLILPL